MIPAPSEQRRLSAYWPVALAAGIRLAVWLMLPANRFASDEDSYYQAGTALLTSGARNLFWPPVTGWLVAGVEWLFQTRSISAVRLVWVAFDCGCALALRTLALRVAAAMYPSDSAQITRSANVAALAYALYLPAVSYAQFATSETPAALLTLLVLVLMTRPGAAAATHAIAGLMAGVLTLTRPSLSPLLILVPAATAWFRRTGRQCVTHLLIFLAAGAIPVGLLVHRNWPTSGEVTIAQNDAYNLYIGNRDLYAEDLNLFSPAATPEQVEFRRQFLSGELRYPTLSSHEMRTEAFRWIRDHPMIFARRSLGRLARVFAPKTDVLELVGGERRAGIFSPPALALVAAANVEWGVILFGGVMGLVALRRYSGELSLLFISTVCGSVLLCLVAIAKPRYSFVFDPLLILGTVIFASRPARALADLRPGERWVLAGIGAFLVWGWVAWTIFALSSRLAMRPL